MEEYKGNHVIRGKGNVSFCGTEYKGYEIILLTYPRFMDDIPESDLFFVGDAEISYLSNGYDAFVDKNFVPALGDDIYLMPGCAIAVADIRKHYNIKRTPDTGTCNIYTPDKDLYWRGIHTDIFNTIVFPDDKQIFCSNIYSLGKGDFLDFVTDQHKGNSLASNYNLLPENVSWTLHHYKMPALHRMILDKTYKKPIILCDRLPIPSDNELTLDQLTLIERLGNEQHSSDGERNFLVQLNALNQYNWREYPGTMSLLFHVFLRRDASRYRCNCPLMRQSTIPKAAKQMVRSGRGESKPNMARAGWMRARRGL